MNRNRNRNRNRTAVDARVGSDQIEWNIYLSPSKRETLSTYLPIYEKFIYVCMKTMMIDIQKRFMLLVFISIRSFRLLLLLLVFLTCYVLRVTCCDCGLWVVVGGCRWLQLLLPNHHHTTTYLHPQLKIHSSVHSFIRSHVHSLSHLTYRGFSSRYET